MKHIETLLKTAEWKLSTYTANGSNSFGKTYNGQIPSLFEQAEINACWSHWNGRVTALREVMRLIQSELTMEQADYEIALQRAAATILKLRGCREDQIDDAIIASLIDHELREPIRDAQRQADALGEAAASRPCICANGEIDTFGTPDPLCRATVHNRKPAGAVEGGREDQIEALAEYAHTAWSGWMRYLFSKTSLDAMCQRTIPREWVARWQRQIDLAYAELREDEKESDRKEARAMLAALHGRAAPQREETKDV